ncbi:MAG: tRNA pseudouridine(13) synthase TruD [Conexivisphaera sp.]
MRVVPPELDVQLGMLAYSTGARALPGSVKGRPEDFIVAEVLSERPGRGPVPTFTVTKIGRNTIDVAEELGRRLGCRIRFWGLKDRQAVTTQFMQCARAGPAVESLEGPGWRARLIGFWEELGPGHFAGNAFAIRVTGSHGGPAEEISRALDSGMIANFFGYQRFGAVNQNQAVGRCIVKHDPRACPDWRSLRSMPLRLRKLMVNAYQSYLFNMALSRLLVERGELPRRSAVSHRVVRRPFPRAIEEPRAEPADGVAAVPSAPVPGYSYRSRGDEYSGALNAVLRDEGVSSRDFYVDEMPEVSAEGSWRPAVIVGAMRHREDDGATVLKMLLQRGSYATVVLRELLKPEDPVSSGLAR